MENKRIVSYKDLEVYQNSYKLMLIIHNEILPFLKKTDFDLNDHISRSTRAIPRLIAEGYAKRHQTRGFQKYLDDSSAECNETCVSLEQVKDLYKYKSDLCIKLVDAYDKCARQCFLLAESWDKFSQKRRHTTDD